MAPSSGCLTWARAMCDVRWLTSWAPAGWMPDHTVDRLANALEMPRTLLDGVVNPRPWMTKKTEGIDWAAHRAGRPWAVLEDECTRLERRVVQRHRAQDHWLFTDAEADPFALLQSWTVLAHRWGIPETAPIYTRPDDDTYRVVPMPARRTPSTWDRVPRRTHTA